MDQRPLALARASMRAREADPEESEGLLIDFKCTAARRQLSLIEVSCSVMCVSVPGRRREHSLELACIRSFARKVLGSACVRSSTHLTDASENSYPRRVDVLDAMVEINGSLGGNSLRGL